MHEPFCGMCDRACHAVSVVFDTLATCHSFMEAACPFMRNMLLHAYCIHICTRTHVVYSSQPWRSFIERICCGMCSAPVGCEALCPELWCYNCSVLVKLIAKLTGMMASCLPNSSSHPSELLEHRHNAAPLTHGTLCRKRNQSTL